MNISNFLDNISQVQNPIVKYILYFIATVLFFIKILYLFTLWIIDSLIIPLLNTPLAFTGLRIIVGQSKTGETWSNNYLLAYKILPWDVFSCKNNKYLILFQLHG